MAALGQDGFFKKGNVAASRRSLAAWQPPSKPEDCFNRLALRASGHAPVSQ